MREMISKLVDLQEILRKVLEYEKQNERLPKDTLAMRKAVEPDKILLEQKQAKLEDNRRLIREQQAQLAELADQAVHIGEKADSVTDLHGSEAIAHESDFNQKEQATLNESNLALVAQNETLELEIAELTERYTAEDERIALEEARIAERVAENDKAIKKLHAERDSLTPGIDKTLFLRFEKIMRRKDGLAIVRVVNGSCEGCHMMVPPQMVTEIRKASQLVSCLSCSRLLYIE